LSPIAILLVIQFLKIFLVQTVSQLALQM
jgi:hypothetical protein